MTYFAFLLAFLAVPLDFLLILTLVEGRQRKPMPGLIEKPGVSRPAVWTAIGLLVLLAIIYTTPWDNYLVAAHVWYYNPKLISGVLLGRVPLEEYIFFVLETLLTGLWWWFLARRMRLPEGLSPGNKVRILSTASLGMVWLASVAILALAWKPGIYLALILAWALPPILLQLAYGADLLWHQRRLVVLAILPLFLYLSAADSLAISSGTWAIDPAQSTGILLGALPLEEAVFFLLTVVLIVFGLTLFLARVSWKTRSNQGRRVSEENLQEPGQLGGSQNQ